MRLSSHRPNSCSTSTLPVPSCHVAAPNYHVKESVQEQNHIGPQFPSSRFHFERINQTPSYNYQAPKLVWRKETPNPPFIQQPLPRRVIPSSRRLFFPALLPLSAPRSSGGPRENLTGPEAYVKMPFLSS